MLEYLSGPLASLNPAEAVIDIQGAGYLVNITLPTFTALEGKPAARLLVHEIIREDAHLLFGFLTQRERDLFRQLLSVSGIGANTARIILSAIPAPELEAVIISGDHARLKNVKGIGTKTAQRIIVDLRDKIKPGDEPLTIQPTTVPGAFDEALAALVTLGFAKPAAQKVLKKIFEGNPAATPEGAIRQALPML